MKTMQNIPLSTLTGSPIPVLGIIEKACSKALLAIENELPEEARFIEAYNQVIDSCKEMFL